MKINPQLLRSKVLRTVSRGLVSTHPEVGWAPERLHVRHVAWGRDRGRGSCGSGFSMDRTDWWARTPRSCCIAATPHGPYPPQGCSSQCFYLSKLHPHFEPIVVLIWSYSSAQMQVLGGSPARYFRITLIWWRLASTRRADISCRRRAMRPALNPVMPCAIERRPWVEAGLEKRDKNGLEPAVEVIPGLRLRSKYKLII
jgi:hypothetical protein